MKQIKTKEEMKTFIVKNKQRFFLWKKKNAKSIISDFTVIESYNDKSFNLKEYCIIDSFPLREEAQKIQWDSIALDTWDIYLLTENEANHYTKVLMARKITEGGKNDKQ